MKCTDNYNGQTAYTEREWLRIQEKEKKEKKKQRKLVFAALALLLLAAAMTFLVYYFVLRSHDYDLTQTYDKSDPVLGTGNSFLTNNVAEGFAEDLCVTGGDTNTNVLALNAYAAGLFDLNGKETVYAKDVFGKRSPASITKVMTALVTLKYGNLDDLVTVTSTVKDIEYGSSVCDIKEGDVLSLRQLLYGMMIASGNDASMMIAEYVGGSVENFVSMMNEEAAKIGATNTHFTNPHGLTDPDHYTTVYDIYLMFQEALKYEVFQDIISRKNYYAEYTRIDGSAVAVTWESTNHYFTGEAESPDNVVIYGGKTGTTDDAGACLALLAKDLYGNPYMSIILHSQDKESLYQEMNQLLSFIEN
ncbi:MAG: serine hydrolase [Candidatus Choladocola sp.]|nr:serine hydrolase [Candidatus Choladocola sp.]